MRGAVVVLVPGMVVAFAVGCALLRAAGEGGPADDEARYTQMRRAMVDYLVRHGWLKSRRVIEAMRQVPRHLFVPEGLRDRAYDDTPLPIGFGQTISAPSIVAIMTELLEPKETHVIFEVGTGSGYQAAVLSKLVKHVYTIEIIPELAESAKKRLAALGYKNVSVKAGDGYRGWPEHAPFDGIIVTCAPTDIPRPLVEQLKDGGKMVIPVGDIGVQQLYLLRKEGGEVVKKAVLPVLFVPMTGEAQNR